MIHQCRINLRHTDPFVIACPARFTPSCGAPPTEHTDKTIQPLAYSLPNRHARTTVYINSIHKAKNNINGMRQTP